MGWFLKDTNRFESECPQKIRPPGRPPVHSSPPRARKPAWRGIKGCGPQCARVQGVRAEYKQEPILTCRLESSCVLKQMTSNQTNDTQKASAMWFPEKGINKRLQETPAPSIFPTHFQRPYRPAVRTPPFHGGDTGSNPVRVAISRIARNRLSIREKSNSRLSGSLYFRKYSLSNQGNKRLRRQRSENLPLSPLP